MREHAVGGLWKGIRAAIFAGFLLGGVMTDAGAATFVVNSFGEQADAIPGDGVAEIQPGTGIATLHAAMEEANAFPGPDTISVNLPFNYGCGCPGGFCKIELKYTRPLPPLNDPTGGTTLTLRSDMYLSGVNVNPSQGEPGYNAALVILSANNEVQNFNALDFPGDGIVISGPGATGNVVEQCEIGAWCGMVRGFGRDAIRLEAGASANIVLNCVAADSVNGIHITGGGSDGNLMTGNRLGQARRDSIVGCGLDVDVITVPTSFPPDCDREIVQGFLDAYLNSSAAPNSAAALFISDGAADNIVGGAGRDLANFVGGANWTRRQAGCFDDLPACGGDIVPPIANGESGVVIDGPDTRGNRIQGNYIGYRNVAVVQEPEHPGGPVTMCPKRDMTGFRKHAIQLRNGARDNIIGHETEPDLGNEIAYSLQEAVVVEGSMTTNNTIANNDIESTADGVLLRGGANGNILGAPDGNGNTISAREYGVEITGAGTSDNTVIGNEIRRSGFSGVAIRGGATHNFIGGDTPGDANFINENCSDGVVIFDPGTDHNQVLGNEIARNGEIGVFIVKGASNNIIGGSVTGAGNDIHDNAVTGVEIHDAASTGNAILGNEIHGNGTRGILMVDGTSGNIVGGSVPAERNTIYENDQSGIEINGAATRENRIRINSVYDNIEKGIFLSFGANEQIAPPLIDRFIPFSGTAAPDSFVDVFSDAAEEGRHYIGTTIADAEGNYSVLLNMTPFIDTNLTATATDANGNTSEFSAPIAIIPPAFVEESADVVIVTGDDLALSITVEGAPEIALQWKFRPDGGATVPLEDGGGFSGVTTSTLSIENGQPAHEGFYQCVADNGLGDVHSREIFVRVVPADLGEVHVNTLADSSDGNTSSMARLLASPGDDGLVSLREALVAANAMAGDNSIRFSVEGAVQVTSPLPAVADDAGSLTLDGGEVMSLDGSLLAETGSGLTLTTAGNHVTGIGIYNFPEHGLVLTGAAAVGNTITGCTVGADDTTIKANGSHGLLLTGGASNNTIGGLDEGEGNVFAGNGSAGIAAEGPGTAGNVIQGNFIGGTGSVNLGNGVAGILLANEASDNIIGGDTDAAGNTITGNGGVGVYVTGGSTRNTIRQNAIFNNADLGIRLFDGGNDAAAAPVFSGITPISGTAPAGSIVECFVDAEDEGELLVMSLVAGSDGTFTGALDLAAYDGMYLTATATDAAGNTSAFSVPAPIDFTPPVLTLSGSASVNLECATPYADPGATASDNLDGDISTLIVRAIVNAAEMPIADIEQAPRGEYTIRYTVADRAGLEAEAVTRTVLVADTAAPTLVLLGEDTVTVSCGEAFNDPGATATDGCAGAVAVTTTGAFDTMKSGTYTLTYEAEDDAGNAAPPVSRTVVVSDSSKPVIALQGENSLTQECGVPFAEPGATAHDTCDGERPVTSTGTVDIENAGTYILTYNAIDSSGNRADPVERIVNVVDSTPPELALNGAQDVILRCGDSYAELGATLTDTCDPGTDVVVSGTLDTNVAGVYTLQYDATDTAGNVATPVLRTVTVVGEKPPVIFLTGEPALTVACNTTYADPGARAQDGCLADITPDLIVENHVDTTQPGTYTVTYRVSDGAGEAAAPVTRTVTVLACVDPCDSQCNGSPADDIDADGDGLSQCREQCVGSSDGNVDSDGDGMPDGFEYDFRLDPTADDSMLDHDGDGSVNLDEYLEGGSPRSADTPATVFFVSASGQDQPSAGTRENPWQTLGYALSRVAPGATPRVRLIVGSSVYAENIELGEQVELRAAEGANVEIMGTIIARTGSRIEGITCTSTGAGMAMMFIEGGGVTVRNCVFDGTFGNNLTGVAIEEGGAPSAIEDTLFSNLDVGVDIGGALPGLRRCQFINISVAAVILRPEITLAEDDESAGYGLNGWNDFGQLGGGLAILNDSGLAVSAQWNDWGTASAAEQAALVEGNVAQDNALPPGSSGEVSGLEVVVFRGASQTRFSGAEVTATGAGGNLNATADGDGRAAFPLIAPGAWQVTVTAAGFPDTTQSVTLRAGSRHVLNVALLHDTVPPPSPAPGGCPTPAKSTAPAGRAGDLALLALLAALFLGGRARKKGTV